MLLPFSSSPFSADHESERMPKGVATSSTTVPCFETCVTARYIVGDSGDQSAGLVTGMERFASLSFPGAIVNVDSVFPTG